ncbi:MAG: hypothetical protein B7X07_06210, partial [Actinobacteria bacterium 21-64-8]
PVETVSLHGNAVAAEAVPLEAMVSPVTTSSDAALTLAKETSAERNARRALEGRKVRMEAWSGRPTCNLAVRRVHQSSPAHQG